jgi:hypothetical protein
VPCAGTCTFCHRGFEPPLQTSNAPLDPFTNKGAQQDPQIKPNAPILDVPPFKMDALVQLFHPGRFAG